jgi:hypothetical protein
MSEAAHCHCAIGQHGLSEVEIEWRLMAFRREFYIQNRRWASGRKNGAGKMSAAARSASSLNRYRRRPIGLRFLLFGICVQ